MLASPLKASSTFITIVMLGMFAVPGGAQPAQGGAVARPEAVAQPGASPLPTDA